jgi:hypothetical protein
VFRLYIGSMFTLFTCFLMVYKFSLTGWDDNYLQRLLICYILSHNLSLKCIFNIQ